MTVKSKAPNEAETGFTSLELDARLLAALGALGYEEPTPIQRQAIPHLLARRDLLAQAATGTGKTAAFALPLLQRLSLEGREGLSPFGLVLVPTRELAMQVAEAVHRYGREMGVHVLAIYGGSSMGLQLRALSRGVDVVVATPGRALDHIRRGSLALAGVKLVVLDEADEMLDMGFAEDLEAILDATTAGRPMALFSATLPERITGLAKRHLRDPVSLRIDGKATGRASASAGKVTQTAYVVARAHKLPALSRILDVEAPASAIVFCRTRTEVDELTETLNARGHRAEALHGGFSQEQRDRVMKRFRSGAAELLIATDVAARGLDIEQVSHVVNYDVPSEPEAYVHRIGRTGRAGRAGTAITLFEPREQWQLKNIERLTKQTITRATVPTVADLRARRLELTRASLREAIVDGGLDRFRVAVESLAEEFDLLDVAAAGVKLAHQASGQARQDEEEIPPVALHPERKPESRRDVARPAPRGRPERRAAGGSVATLFIGAGRGAGIRPADLFGAITGEASLSPRDIGAIEIADRFSLVEVPEEAAEEVIAALRATKIRGKKVVVRRERDDPPPRPPRR